MIGSSQSTEPERANACHPASYRDCGRKIEGMVGLLPSTNDSFVDVLAEGLDAGVRYGERMELDMITVPVAPRVQRFVTAGSPGYRKARGHPSHPKDLSHHACIRHRFPSGVSLPWEFERDGEVLKISPTGPLVATMIDLELVAAIQGLGLIHGFEGFLSPAVADGDLELVLQDWAQSFPGPFLYYPSRRHMPAPLRAFVDFLKGEHGASAGA